MKETPVEDGYFDLVKQLSAFSSIPSARLRQHVAAEVGRVVKPAGGFIGTSLPWTALCRRSTAIASLGGSMPGGARP